MTSMVIRSTIYTEHIHKVNLPMSYSQGSSVNDLKVLLAIKAFSNINISGRVAQSVTCLTTDTCLTADLGAESLIPGPVPYFR